MSVLASAKDLKDEQGTSIVAAVSITDPEVPEVTLVLCLITWARKGKGKSQKRSACWMSSDRNWDCVPVR